MPHLLARMAAVIALLSALDVTSLAQNIVYRLESAKPLHRFSARQIVLLAKLNHADEVNLEHFSKLIVPSRWGADELQYSPMPRRVETLAGESKALVVDLEAQTFGAYEYGSLVRWGPISSGDAEHQTPAGIYHLNWHALLRTSSENASWIMPWYFNFSSELGLALHEYALPGRPASHGCVRLLAIDAKWLYAWGDGWVVDENTRQVIRPGTLVLLLGQYDFTARQPWLNPRWWKRGITLEIDAANGADVSR